MEDQHERTIAELISQCKLYAYGAAWALFFMADGDIEAVALHSATAETDVRALVELGGQALGVVARGGEQPPVYHLHLLARAYELSKITAGPAMCFLRGWARIQAEALGDERYSLMPEPCDAADAA